jgi:hypothetical protein
MFNILSNGLKILKNKEVKFRTDLRKYLNTQSFYSIYTYMFLCEDDQ